jgi:ubiquinone/menaquinone biosynthesis C-methylase UbiE
VNFHEPGGFDRFVAGDDGLGAGFLSMQLSRLDVAGQQLLELGCGPGGNLLALVQRRPKQLVGVDISESMLTLARDNLAGHEVTLKKTDGRQIPLPNHSVDLAYTVTVLQHNVDPTQLDAVVSELWRVARDRIVVAEDIGNVTDPPPEATYVTRAQWSPTGQHSLSRASNWYQ